MKKLKKIIPSLVDQDQRHQRREKVVFEEIASLFDPAG